MKIHCEVQDAKWTAQQMQRERRAGLKHINCVWKVAKSDQNSMFSLSRDNGVTLEFSKQHFRKATLQNMLSHGHFLIG